MPRDEMRAHISFLLQKLKDQDSTTSLHKYELCVAIASIPEVAGLLKQEDFYGFLEGAVQRIANRIEDTNLINSFRTIKALIKPEQLKCLLQPILKTLMNLDLNFSMAELQTLIAFDYPLKTEKIIILYQRYLAQDLFDRGLNYHPALTTQQYIAPYLNSKQCN